MVFIMSKSSFTKFYQVNVKKKCYICEFSTIEIFEGYQQKISLKKIISK